MQVIRRSTSRYSLLAAPRRRIRSCSRLARFCLASNRPAMISSAPELISCCSCSCSCGATRWRCTSHSTAIWRRKRRRSWRLSLCHSFSFIGLRPSITARQSCPSRSARATRIRIKRHSSSSVVGACSGFSQATIVATLTLRWALGRCPRRDRATIGPRWPLPRSDTTTSTMVRPVPNSATLASGSRSAVASAHQPWRCWGSSRSGRGMALLPQASTTRSASIGSLLLNCKR